MKDEKRAADDAEREFSELIDCYQSAESLRERVEVRREMMAAFRAALSARADGGKDSRDAALDALKRAERFIVNGTEFGYIRMPDAPDPALDTLPAIRKAIAAIAKEKK